MDIINNQITVNNTAFFATTTSSQEPTATVMFRITGGGKVDELLNHPRSGVVRLNKWQVEGAARKIIILKIDGKDGGIRHVRAACSKAIVEAIQTGENGLDPGQVFCGRGIATVQYKRKDLTPDTEVTFTRQ